MTEKSHEKRGPLKIPRSNLPYYGQSVGIIMTDPSSTDASDASVTGEHTVQREGFTRVPGDVGNATSFTFSVQYQLIRDLNINDVIARRPTEKGISKMVEAARELERQGVRAITTMCGLFSWFQPLLTEAVEVPVVTSALMQVPMVSVAIGKGRKVGIITANSDILTGAHLEAVGIDASIPHVLWGIQERPDDESFWVFDEVDPEKRLRRLEDALSLTAVRMVEANPDVDAIVLECTNTPPGAWAVQQATGLPVFDVITMIEWAHLGVARRRFCGYM